METNFVYLTHL